MAGKIQNEDLKSAAELVSVGGNASQLPNDTKIYVTANGINDTLNNAITNGQISGSSGITNYIPSAISQGKTVSGITTYLNTVPGATPTTSVSGASVSTLVSSTNTSLVGSTNLLWTKSANNRQGEGFYIPFTIDSGIRGKLLNITALYSVASGTFVSGDFTIWVYDVTNNAFTAAFNSGLPLTSSVGDLSCDFLAATNSTSYRLYFHTSTTSALAYSLRFTSLSIQFSKRVYCEYNDNAGTAVSTSINIPFITKISDSHNAWSGSLFTAPRSTTYVFEGQFTEISNSGASAQFYVNGSIKRIYGTDSGSTYKPFHFKWFLNEGQTMSIRPNNSYTLTSDTLRHYMQIYSVD